MTVLSESGYSLVFVYAVIAIAALILLSVHLSGVKTHKQVQQTYNQTQAFYNAESGIQIVGECLQNGEFSRTKEQHIELPWGDDCDVSYTLWGGFCLVHSIGSCGNQRVKITCLLGDASSYLRTDALTVLDTSSPLNITGDCEISGSIRTGVKGAGIVDFHGEMFTGLVSGPVIEDSTLAPPVVSSALVDAYVSKQDLLANMEQPFEYFFDFYEVGARSNTGPKRFYSDERIQLDSNWNHLSDGLEMFSAESIILTESFAFPDFSLFVAQDSIIIEGEVTGDLGLFIAGTIIIQDSVNCNGQFLATKKLCTYGSPILTYPSVLALVDQELANPASELNIGGSTCISGTVCIPFDPDISLPRASLTIEERACIHGLIIDLGETENYGSILGSLVTNRPYFYDAPVHYINWMRTGHFQYCEDYSMAPSPFLFHENAFPSVAKVLDVVYYQK